MAGTRTATRLAGSLLAQSRVPVVSAVQLRETRRRTESAVARATRGIAVMAAADTSSYDKSTSDGKWKEVLGTEEYRILRQKGTEAPGTGEYNKFYEDGTYRCGGCGTPLYKSETKFDSGCGWPAFYAEIPGTVDRHVDSTFGMKRTEITCTKCGGHLGHVFENEGFDNPTNERHCVNSKSLKFNKG